MAYLTLNLEKILGNYKILNQLCLSQEIDFVPVTKCFFSHEPLCQALYDAGCRMVADSHWQNFAAWDQRLPLKRLLLLVSPSQIAESLQHSDVVMVSDLEILTRLTQENQGKKTSVILPLETGENRDGILPDELPRFLDQAAKLDRVEVRGLALIFGCMKGFIPKEEDLRWAENFSRRIAEISGGYPLPYSAGGTIFNDFLFQGKLKGLVRQLRMGEALFFGYNTYLGEPISHLQEGGVILGAEILEVREKEEDFYHDVGLNSFGFKPEKSGNLGKRKQAVLDVGFLYSIQGQMAGLPEGVEVLSNSHDHTVLDVTEARRSWKAGEIMEFIPRYDLASYCMTLPYIKKFYTQI